MCVTFSVGIVPLLGRIESEMAIAATESACVVQTYDDWLLHLTRFVATFTSYQALHGFLYFSNEDELSRPQLVARDRRGPVQFSHISLHTSP